MRTAVRSWNFTENFWQFLILAAVCYFIGCFNFARFISKKKHKDITKIGSGNPGTMNMSREFGWKIGVITFFCDAFKGGLPTLAAHLIFRKFVFSGSDVCVADVARYLAALFVIIGHIFPVTNCFKGGKGIASTFGGFWFGLACENPWFLLLGFLFFGAEKNVYFAAAMLLLLLLNVFTWGAHHKNVWRLLSGTEHRTSVKKIAKKG